MTRRIKTLGIALAAVFAMTAVMAVGAQAATEHTFESATSPTEIVGVAHTEDHVFQIGGAEGPSITCKDILFEGEEAGTQRDTVTVVPTYADCEGFLGEAEVVTNHCAYVFDSDTTTGPNEEHASVTVECAEGNQIEIIEPGVCKMGIGPQTVDQGVHYTKSSENGFETITVDATATGIDYKKISGSFCFLLPGGGTGSDGTYNGNAEVTGYEGDGSNLEGTVKTTPVLNKGQQVDITMTTP